MEVWLLNGSSLRSLVHHTYGCCQRSSRCCFLSLLLCSSHPLLRKAIITRVLLHSKNCACTPKFTRIQSIHNNWHVSLRAWPHVSLRAWPSLLIGKHNIVPLLLSFQLINPLLEFSMLLIQLRLLFLKHNNLLHKHVMVVFLTFEFNLKLVPFFEENLLFLISLLSALSHYLKVTGQIFFILFNIVSILFLFFIFVLQLFLVALEVLGKLDPNSVSVILENSFGLCLKFLDTPVNALKCFVNQFDIFLAWLHFNMFFWFTKLHMICFLSICSIRFLQVQLDSSKLNLVFGLFFDLLKRLLAALINLKFDLFNGAPIFLLSENVLLLF